MLPHTLHAIATDIRTFLLPHWRLWHRAWGPPAPSTPSQWTCVRSSLFVVRAVERHGVPAAFCSGQPRDGEARADARPAGLSTGDGWVSHAWVETAGWIIDITADQFGHAPVIVTSVDDPTYRRADDEAYRLMPTRAGLAAVEKIWPCWCRHADQ